VRDRAYELGAPENLARDDEERDSDHEPCAHSEHMSCGLADAAPDRGDLPRASGHQGKCGRAAVVQDTQTQMRSRPMLRLGCRRQTIALRCRHTVGCSSSGRCSSASRIACLRPPDRAARRPRPELCPAARQPAARRSAQAARDPGLPAPAFRLTEHHRSVCLRVPWAIPRSRALLLRSAAGAPRHRALRWDACPALGAPPRTAAAGRSSAVPEGS
jgi:hypothetical protein